MFDLFANYKNDMMLYVFIEKGANIYFSINIFLIATAFRKLLFFFYLFYNRLQV